MTKDALTQEERDLLTELLSEGKPSDDPKVQRALARSPALAREYAQLLQVAAALRQSGSEHRNSVAEAVQNTAPADIALAGAFVRRHAHELGRRTWWWRYVAAAAVALALVFLVKTAWRADNSPSDPFLSTGGGARQAAPAGSVAAFDQFVWPAAPNARDGYRLRIYAAADRRAVGAAIVDTPVAGNAWQPNPTQQTQLRGHVSIAWTVEYIDGDGEGRAWVPPTFAQRSR